MSRPMLLRLRPAPPPKEDLPALRVPSHRWRGHLPGVGVSMLVAAFAALAAQTPWLRVHGISMLTLAIVLGMVAGNTVYPRIAALADPGVGYAKQSLLRLGIILYGLRLTFQDIANVGMAGVLIDALVLSSTFALSCWAGTRVLGLDRSTAMLIGAGSSICGAAAVMAAEPVVRGRAEQVTVAIATVVVFGTLAMFLYPALYRLNWGWPAGAVSPRAYGLFAGSTIHEVAQVVAAGRAAGEAAADTAVIAKMVRVMMLAPFLIVLSAYLSRTAARGIGATGESRAAEGRGTASAMVIPWFALGFVAVAGLHSLAVVPPTVVNTAVSVDTALLSTAMSALGLTTRWSAIRTAGLKPLALGAVLFLWLVVGGAAINAAITAACRY